MKTQRTPRICSRTIFSTIIISMMFQIQIDPTFIVFLLKINITGWETKTISLRGQDSNSSILDWTFSIENQTCLTLCWSFIRSHNSIISKPEYGVVKSQHLKDIFVSKVGNKLTEQEFWKEFYVYNNRFIQIFIIFVGT